jgi:GNAT superfamily N-acetyltransferase
MPLRSLRPRPGRDGVLETVGVRRGRDYTLLVDAELVGRTDRAEAVDRDARSRVDVDDLALAVCIRQAGLGVVLEERVVARAKHENVGRGGDPEAPRGVDRTVGVRVGRVNREGRRRRRARLVVRRLGLNEAHVVVLGADEGVLVQRKVLGSCRAQSVDERASSRGET